jgi:hypothetical protein
MTLNRRSGIRILGTAVLGVGLSASSASAKTGELASEPVTPLPRAAMLADNVVVTPGNGGPAAAPAFVPAASSTTVNTAPAGQPVDAAPRRTTVVQEQDHNYVATVAVSAIMGAVLGAVVGGAIYYLGNRDHADRIGYWAAGGVLVGAGVGIVQVAVQESRADEAVASRFPTDPAPTFRLALLDTRF